MIVTPPDVLFTNVDLETSNLIHRAIAVAQNCVLEKVPYLYAGKNRRGLDSSGLIEFCYSPILPSGSFNQRQHIKAWLFEDDDIRLIEEGDLLFFSREQEPSEVSHVGLVESVDLGRINIIHAIEVDVQVSRDFFSVTEKIVKNIHRLTAVGKMRPFLLRTLLDDAINTEVENASSITSRS